MITRHGPLRLLRVLLAPFVIAGLALAMAGPAPAETGRGSPRTGSTEFAVAPSRPGVVDAYIVSFGLWGPQSVFESEARGAARVLAAQLHSPDRSIVRFNGKRRADATPERLQAALQAAARAMDRDEDVLVLVLTSHGGPDGIAMVAGRDRRLLTPAFVRALLDETGARYRVLIVSACYSGIFARQLADPRTLVITAAAPDRPSFGCQDGATWTYFGDAFFNRALRGAPALDQAFAQAKELVTKRERAEGFDPSLPQMAGGAEVLAKLADIHGQAAPGSTAAPCGRPQASPGAAQPEAARRPAEACSPRPLR